MNQATARQLVLVSMLVSGGVVTYDLLANKENLSDDQKFRAVWSLALLFLLLAMAADTVPEIAGPFAGLVMLAIVVGRQGTLGRIVAIGGGAAAPKGKPAGTSGRNVGAFKPKGGKI